MRKVLSKVALAATVLMGVSTAANAYVVLTIRDTQNAVTKTCDTSAAATLTNCNGFIYTLGGESATLLGFTIGEYTIGGSLGSSNAPGTPVLGSVNATNLTITRTADFGAVNTLGDLFVEIAGYGFTQPPGTAKSFSGSASYTSGLHGTLGDETVRGDFFVSADPNGPFSALPQGACGVALPGGGSATQSIGDSCQTGSVNWTDGPPNGYSLDAKLYSQMRVGSVFNTTVTLNTTVPEPVSTALVGIALAGLGLASRRRAVRKA